MRIMSAENVSFREWHGVAVTHLHSVFLRYCTDVVRSGDSARNRSLLLVICEALASEVSTTALRHLKDNRCFDIAYCTVMSTWVSVPKKELTERLREQRSQWKRK